MGNRTTFFCHPRYEKQANESPTSSNFFPIHEQCNCATPAQAKANASQKLFATIDSILFYLFLPISGECQRFRKRATVFATSFPFPRGFSQKKFFFAIASHSKSACDRALRPHPASSGFLPPPSLNTPDAPTLLRIHTLHQKRRIYNRPPRLFQAAEKIKHGVNEEKSMDKSFLVKKYVVYSS